VHNIAHLGRKDDAVRQTVLLVESNCSSAAIVEQALLASGDAQFVVERVRKCSEAQERLSMRRPRCIAAVVANLFLPDSQGIQTIVRIFEVSPHIPILVLTNADHEHIAKQAVQRGAQDYVLQHRLDSYSLPTILRNMLNSEAIPPALLLDTERVPLPLSSIGDAVISTDVAGHVTFLNPVAEEMTGWSMHEVLGLTFDDAFRITDGERCGSVNSTSLAVQQKKEVHLPPDSILIGRGGIEYTVEGLAAPVCDSMGNAVGAILVFRDITQSPAASPGTCGLSLHDALTDLPGRLLIDDRISQAIASARRLQRQLAVLYIGIDCFKHVNGSLGHAIGDQLLVSIADRLIAAVRESDTVGRQGGDEFVVLLSPVADGEDAALSAQKILNSLSTPHLIARHNLQVTASIGIGIYPDDGADAATLVKNSGIAMLIAKEQGRNNCAFFKPHMNERAIERRFLETGLRHALDRQEFVLYYQPQLDLHTEALVGAEALIRWRRPKRGLLLPSEFIPVAERSGYIVPIGLWVLREACRQAKSWRDAGLAPIPVAVNISAAELLSRNFVESVRFILQDTGFEPHFLELEVTEIALAKDVQATASVLCELKDMNVQLVLDHFGTGSSSLTHLRRFPVDALKIDESLVHALGTCTYDADIVNAVIWTGRSFHSRVIAAGVETREQFLALRSRQCTEGQGRYFREPIPANEFTKLLGAASFTTIVA
jgi:diguanylate cyclase (GGDEF)-like protein/PAS domain S-box-containing protein